MKLDRLIKIFGVVATLSAGLFALLTYFESQRQADLKESLRIEKQKEIEQRERVERTLSLLEKFSSEPLVGYGKQTREFINRSLRKMTSETVPLLGGQRTLSGKMAGENQVIDSLLLDRAVRSRAKADSFIVEVDKNIRDPLLSLISFLDRASDCVKGRLCDEATARQSFGPIASELGVYFWPYIHAVRISEDDQFGRGIAFFGLRFQVREPGPIRRRPPARARR